MSSILDEIDDTLFSGDLKIIKDKIFKRCNGQNIKTCELIDVYTLVKQLEIDFHEIDWLIENGFCIEIPRAIKHTPYLIGATMGSKNDGTKFIKTSNLDICKEYMQDKEAFCKKYCDELSYFDHDAKARDMIDRTIMCCYLSMTPEIEFEYTEYMDEHKPTVRTDWSNIFGQLSTGTGNISSNYYSKTYDANGVCWVDTNEIDARACSTIDVCKSSDLPSNMSAGGLSAYN